MNILKFNWPYAFFAGSLCIGVFLIVAGSLTLRHVLGAPGSEGESWGAIALIDAICIGFCAWFLWNIYAHSKAELTDEFLKKPTLFGTVTIRWEEVTRIELGQGIQVFCGKASIGIAPFAYINSKEVFAVVARHQKNLGGHIAA